MALGMGFRRLLLSPDRQQHCGSAYAFYQNQFNLKGQACLSLQSVKVLQYKPAGRCVQRRGAVSTASDPANEAKFAFSESSSVENMLNHIKTATGVVFPEHKEVLYRTTAFQIIYIYISLRGRLG
jgi:hypothetical protein